MRDKLVKINKSHFNIVAKRLAIIGSIIIVLTFVLGLPIINVLNSQNQNLVNDIQKEEKRISNLQLQLEDGTINNN